MADGGDIPIDPHEERSVYLVSLCLLSGLFVLLLLARLYGNVSRDLRRGTRVVRNKVGFSLGLGPGIAEE